MSRIRLEVGAFAAELSVVSLRRNEPDLIDGGGSAWTACGVCRTTNHTASVLLTRVSTGSDVERLPPTPIALSVLREGVREREENQNGREKEHSISTPPSDANTNTTRYDTTFNLKKKRQFIFSEQNNFEMTIK